MSYQEKRTLTTMITTVLVFGAYCLSAFSQYTLADPVQDWARTMLLFLVVSAATAIIVQIVFHVLLSIGMAVREAVSEGENVDEAKIEQAIKHEFTEDEREKLIALKSQQAGFIVSGVGFAVGLIVLALGFSVPLMLNIMYTAFFLGSIVENIMTLVNNRRELRHA